MALALNLVGPRAGAGVEEAKAAGDAEGSVGGTGDAEVAKVGAYTEDAEVAGRPEEAEASGDTEGAVSGALCNPAGQNLR